MEHNCTTDDEDVSVWHALKEEEEVVNKRTAEAYLESEIISTIDDENLSQVTTSIVDDENMSRVTTSITDWENSYVNKNGKKNKNTGVKPEIITGKLILVFSGLDTKENLGLHIADSNDKLKQLEIFKNVKGIINLTQDDNTGGTGDIGILYNDGTRIYYSITKPQRKKINKCIKNPSGMKFYNINKENFEKMDNHYFNQAIDWLKANKGETPNAEWRKRIKHPDYNFAKKACTTIAKRASDNWNQKSISERRELLLEILDIDKNSLKTNTQGIIYADENEIKKIIDWTLKINVEDYIHTVSEGVYIYHCKNPEDFKNTWILKTQCKYNNGIVEKKKDPEDPEKWTPKKGNLFSSWNATCEIERTFNITKKY